MFQKYDETVSPTKVFSDRSEAQKVADSITAKPRSGEARIQFSGYYNGWLVEVRPRSQPYCNPAYLRENGELAKYH